MVAVDRNRVLQNAEICFWAVGAKPGSQQKITSYLTDHGVLHYAAVQKKTDLDCVEPALGMICFSLVFDSKRNKSGLGGAWAGDAQFALNFK